MRKKIVAGNWKMNLNLDEALNLNKTTESQLLDPKCDVYQFVPSLYIPLLIEKKGYIQIGAQNGHPANSGAFTGEISMQQLREIGVQSVLIGHSERRHIFHENDDFLKEKIDAALANKLTPFFCCGETLEQRENNVHMETVVKQIEKSCFHLSPEQFRRLVIAYEPVWAIGTGKTASPEQANEMHRVLRDAIENKYNNEIAENTTILYGGSCKPSNAKELFNMEHIDGGLIGGASLKADDFIQIVNTFN
jgi:triosephosphate isomerase